VRWSLNPNETHRLSANTGGVVPMLSSQAFAAIPGQTSWYGVHERASKSASLQATQPAGSGAIVPCTARYLRTLLHVYRLIFLRRDLDATIADAMWGIPSYPLLIRTHVRLRGTSDRLPSPLPSVLAVAIYGGELTCTSRYIASS
jgi:hypothetical protein